MSYNTYIPDEVEIDWLILSKLTKYDNLNHDENIPLEKEELKNYSYYQVNYKEMNY